jgi:hypothetical protein
MSLNNKRSHSSVDTESSSSDGDESSLASSSICTRSQLCFSSSEALLSKLTSDSILLANTIASTLKRDDPGLICQILSPYDLHAALALAGSPIPQAQDQLASSDAFKQWIIQQALMSPGVNANNQEPPNTLSMAFHHLSEEQANDIVYQRWLCVPWVAQLQQHPQLSMPLVLWFTGTGKGKAHMFEAKQVFG